MKIRHTMDGTGEDGYIAMMERKKMHEEAKLRGLQDASDEQNDYNAVSRLAEEMYQIAKDHGFHDDDIPEPVGNWCANLHGEVSELWEAYRRGDLLQPCDKNGIILCCAGEELADIVIRAMDTAVALGIDIGQAIKEKSNYNRGRPRRHGGKKA